MGGCLINENLCYKKLNKYVLNLDRMSCTKIVFFIKNYEKIKNILQCHAHKFCKKNKD